jgi:hypothetical protein
VFFAAFSNLLAIDWRECQAWKTLENRLPNAFMGINLIKEKLISVTALR